MKPVPAEGSADLALLGTTTRPALPAVDVSHVTGTDMGLIVKKTIHGRHQDMVSTWVNNFAENRKKIGGWGRTAANASRMSTTESLITYKFRIETHEQ